MILGHTPFAFCNGSILMRNSTDISARKKVVVSLAVKNTTPAKGRDWKLFASKNFVRSMRLRITIMRKNVAGIILLSRSATFRGTLAEVFRVLLLACSLDKVM